MISSAFILLVLKQKFIKPINGKHQTNQHLLKIDKKSYKKLIFTTLDISQSKVIVIMRVLIA